MTKDQIREIFLAHGFTVKEGQTDLKPYVYAAARALLEAALKPGGESLADKFSAMHANGGVWITTIAAAKLAMAAAPPAQTPVEHCQSCGDVATRHLPEEATAFPGSYCDQCGQGTAAPPAQTPTHEAVAMRGDVRRKMAECISAIYPAVRGKFPAEQALDELIDLIAYPAQTPSEPVYAFRRKGLDDFCTCDERRYIEFKNKPHLFEVATFYRAAPPAQTPDDRATELLELFDDPALPEHSGCASKTPPPRLTIEEIDMAWFAAEALDKEYACIRAIETAVRRQFGVNDE